MNIFALSPHSQKVHMWFTEGSKPRIIDSIQISGDHRFQVNNFHAMEADIMKTFCTQLIVSNLMQFCGFSAAQNTNSKRFRIYFNLMWFAKNCFISLHCRQQCSIHFRRKIQFETQPRYLTSLYSQWFLLSHPHGWSAYYCVCIVLTARNNVKKSCEVINY